MPMRAPRPLAFLLFALLPGCASPAPNRFDACAEPRVSTAEWEKRDGLAFDFRLPPGYRREEFIPTDSKVERWKAGPGRLVTYDLGGYSSRLEEMRVLGGYSECTVKIGGGRAKVVAGWDEDGGMFEDGPGKYVVAATWRDIVPGLHLTLGASTPDRAEAERMLAMIRSVELRRERLGE
jgi:hypothetical protein